MPALLTRTAGSVGLRTARQLGLTGTASTAPGVLPFVAGRFSVYDQWTQISDRDGRFMEKISRGAFADTIKRDRAHIRLLFQHGQDPFIGSRPIAPLDVLGEDGAGAYYAGRLFDTLAARELVPLLQAGVLGSSFRFTADRVRVDDRPMRSDSNPERLPEHVILAATLYELGPVTFPAYRGATAGTSTGEHPPRSARRPRMTVDEFNEWLTNPPGETAEAVAARMRWLDAVAPLPWRR